MKITSKCYLAPLMFISFLLIAGFYWFEYRPAKIKHDCSWKLVHQDAEPATPEKPYYSKEEKEQILGNSLKNLDFWEKMNNDIALEHLNDVYPGHDAVPGKDYWTKTSETEYTFCIREHGL